MLSCDCEWDGPDDYGQKYWRSDDDYSQYNKLIRKQCCGCDHKVKYGDTVLRIFRYRSPSYWEELNMGYDFDTEISLATHYLCEKCADVFFSLSDLGFCVDPYMPRVEALEAYQEYVDYRKANDYQIVTSAHLHRLTL